MLNVEVLRSWQVKDDVEIARKIWDVKRNHPGGFLNITCPLRRALDQKYCQWHTTQILEPE